MDHKWGAPVMGTPSGEISWSDDLSGLTVSSGYTSADLVVSLNAAFAAWEDVAAVNFGESAGAVDITVTSRSFLTEDTPYSVPGNDQTLDDNAVGLAWISDTVDGLNEPAPVLIEFNEDDTWSPFNMGDPGSINFFVVAAHEIGHALGLDHTSDSSQLMHATIFVNDLADGDKAGAQALYGTDGDDEVIEGVEEEGSEVFNEGGGGGGGGGAGLLLGLLALVFGFLSGGVGFAAAAATGGAAIGDGDQDHHDDGPDHDDHEHLYDPESGMIGHLVFLPQIPAENFPQPILDDEDDVDLFWL